MKTQISTLLAFIFLLLSCNEPTKNQTSSDSRNSGIYSGPIIDMQPDAKLYVKNTYHEIFNLGELVFINGHFKGGWGDSTNGGTFEGT